MFGCSQFSLSLQICFNFHSTSMFGCLDHQLDHVHFMGGSKNFAPEILCGDPSYTGEAPDGYGCAGRA